MSARQKLKYEITGRIIAKRIEIDDELLADTRQLIPEVNEVGEQHRRLLHWTS